MVSKPKPIDLPNGGWQPRPDQLPLWSYMEHGGTRAIEIAHRRWGKDDIALHFTAIAANDVGYEGCRGRIGNYWHMLPLATQSRKAIWEAVNPRTGKRRIDDAFPREVIEDRREGDMFIRFKCGSTWQVVGSDNFQGLLGSPPVGLVYSEWALADPHSWALLSPILEENGGKALFITTPRGRNHAHRMYESFKQRMAQGQDYFAQKITADDTPVFTPERLVNARQDLVDIYGEDDGDALFQQEYYCSFDAPLVGAYYAKLIAWLENNGRITDAVQWDPHYPVETAWDLGFSDDTSIWWYQVVGGELRVLDYYFANNQAPDHYAEEINDRNLMYGWRYYQDDPRSSLHWVPWDARPKTLASGGKSLLEIFWFDHHIGMRVAPNVSVRDGIDNVRKLLRKTWFHPRCVKGLDCLRNYRREWDEDRKCFKDVPLHDWTSHGADAFRILANAYQQRERVAQPFTDVKTHSGPTIIIPTFNDMLEYNIAHRNDEQRIG